jgi:hypothetical protein
MRMRWALLLLIILALPSTGIDVPCCDGPQDECCDMAGHCATGPSGQCVLSVAVPVAPNAFPVAVASTPSSPVAGPDVPDRTPLLSATNQTTRPVPIYLALLSLRL